MSEQVRNSRAWHYALWAMQIILALVFAFAGVMKLITPYDRMKGPIQLPEMLLRFIGVCEVLGAIGLVLPSLLRVMPGLTPLAAACLAIVMVGATVTTIMGGMAATAALPFVVLILCLIVAIGRWRVAPIGGK